MKRYESLKLSSSYLIFDRESMTFENKNRVDFNFQYLKLVLLQKSYSN